MVLSKGGRFSQAAAHASVSTTNRTVPLSSWRRTHATARESQGLLVAPWPSGTLILLSFAHPMSRGKDARRFSLEEG
jgi:hypothetical protein